MLITIQNNIYSQVDGTSIHTLREFLSYDHEYWTRAAGILKRNTYKVFLVDKKGFFLTGLIPLIQEKWPDTTVEYNDFPFFLSVKPCYKLGSVELRHEQIRALNATLKYKRGILQAPTGFGKTIVGAALIASFKPTPQTLFLVHKVDLLKQTVDRFSELLKIPIGSIGDGGTTVREVTVAMIQTLCKWPTDQLQDFGSRIELVIVDEAHHAQSPSYVNVLSNINASYRIGLTATPKNMKEKGDWLRVTGVLGPVIRSITLEDIKDKIALGSVVVIKNKLDSIYSDLFWPEVYDKGVVENESRNKLVAQIISKYHTPHLSTLVIVKRIGHGEILADMIPNSIFIQGSDSSDTRERVKYILKNNKGQVVISTPIFGEGVDIPELDLLVNAGGGASERVTVQQVGRVLRKTENKTTGYIVDLLDVGNRYLRSHASRRVKVYKELGFSVEVLDALPD